jgi:DNA-binding NarL/FixJ family response regulator
MDTNTNNPPGNDQELILPFCGVSRCKTCLLNLNRGAQPPTSAVPLDAAHHQARAPAGGPQLGLGVAVVGNNAPLWKILDHIFRSPNEFRSSGFFTCGARAIKDLPAVPVHLVLVHLTLKDMCGGRCALEVQTKVPHLRAIMVAASVDPSLISAVATMGVQVHGWLVPPFSEKQCLGTLRLALYHQAPKSSPATGQRTTLLSKGEEKVMECFADGLSYKETAARLNLSKIW